MKLPVVISTRNRLELLKQTLESLKKNSDSELEIVVVDDASDDGKTEQFLKMRSGVDVNYRFLKKVSIAEVKKKGFEFAEKGEFIYFSDDDVYFEPHWDTKLIRVFRAFGDIGVVGGRHHPHHQIFSTRQFEGNNIMICEQQAGYSLFLRQEDYLDIGGYEVSERTANGGEDSLVCDMIKDKGKLVASIDPPVIIHCGMYNWQGWKAADYPVMEILKIQRPEVKFL